MAAAAVAILESQRPSPRVLQSKSPSIRVSEHPHHCRQVSHRIACECLCVRKQFFLLNSRAAAACGIWHLATHGCGAAQVASENELARTQTGQRHD